MYIHTRQIRGEVIEIRKLVDPFDLVLWGWLYTIDRKISMPRQLSISFGYIMNHDCVNFATCIIIILTC